MVREISVEPLLAPGMVKVGGEIPEFQYRGSIRQEIARRQLTEEGAVDLLECMLTVRSFEQMIVDLKEKKGQYGSLKYLYVGPSHVSLGQEAIPVGSIRCLQVTDCITSHHRGHGDALAKGYFAIKAMDKEALLSLIAGDAEICRHLGISWGEEDEIEALVQKGMQLHVYKAIAELFGKEHGYCHGRGGGMHIADFSKGHLGANAIVGGSLGMGVGAALAARYLNEGTVVFCFAGDGAFNNGIAHEAMNMATMSQFTNGLMRRTEGVPVIFGVVNNQYGMSGQQRGEVTGIQYLSERAFGYNRAGMHAEIVNGMDVLAVLNAAQRAIANARAGKGPNLLEFWCARYKGHSLSDVLRDKHDETYRTIEELRAWKHIDPIEIYTQRLIGEGLLAQEEIDALKNKVRERNMFLAVKAAEAPSPSPTAIHRGIFSETSSGSVPAPHRPRKPKKRVAVRGDEAITYREAIIEALGEEMNRDSRVLVWGEDVADYGGAFKATEGLLHTFGRDRIFNTPISEAAIVGTGIGAALKDLRPVVEIMYIDFILQAMDQVANQAAKWKYMSGGQPCIPLTIRTTIGGGKGYAGQHSQSIEGILAHFPGLKIVLPSTAYDAKGLLKAAIRDDNPVIFIEHQNLYKRPEGKGVVPLDEYLIAFGEAAVRRRLPASNSSLALTIVSWSYMVSAALAAAEELAVRGIETEIIDLRTLAPLDIDTIIDSVKRTGRVLVAHQAIQCMGFGAEIAAQIQEKAFDYLDGPVTRVAAPNLPPPAAQVLEKAYLPNKDSIIEAARTMFG